MATTATLTSTRQDRWGRPSVFRRIARVPYASADLTRRGVTPADAERAELLEGIARQFLDGYNAMLDGSPLEQLEDVLARTPTTRHGFVVEGAAMGAAIRDGLSLRAGLLETLVGRYSDRFEYLMAVGAGWAIARMPWRATRIQAAFDPLLGALACDGRGFHDIYFSPKASETGAIQKYRGASARSYDAGLGRALWFIGSGDVVRVVELINHFRADRRANLCSGVGLAMAYAGPATQTDWNTLRALCGVDWAYVGQGVCFAAEALRRSGAIPAHSTLACQTALGLGFDAAADIAAKRRPVDVSPAVAAERYDSWRNDVRQALPTIEPSPIKPNPIKPSPIKPSPIKPSQGVAQ